jgi:hypothetical protein
MAPPERDTRRLPPEPGEILRDLNGKVNEFAAST